MLNDADESQNLGECNDSDGILMLCTDLLYLYVTVCLCVCDRTADRNDFELKLGAVSRLQTNARYEEITLEYFTL